MNFMLIVFETRVFGFRMKLLFRMKVVVFAVKEGAMETLALEGAVHGYLYLRARNFRGSPFRGVLLSYLNGWLSVPFCVAS